MHGGLCGWCMVVHGWCMVVHGCVCRWCMVVHGGVCKWCMVVHGGVCRWCMVAPCGYGSSPAAFRWIMGMMMWGVRCPNK